MKNEIILEDGDMVYSDVATWFNIGIIDDMETAEPYIAINLGDGVRAMRIGLAISFMRALSERIAICQENLPDKESVQ